MRATESAAAASDRTARVRAQGADRLGFYRVLASMPLLATYRAKFVAVAAAGTVLPAFLLVVIIVLGAGRLGLLALVAVVVLLAAVAFAFLVHAIDRLLVPLDAAEKAIDDLAFGEAIERIDVPGTDSAAQVLRGVQGLAQRVEREARGAKERGERDGLTGLLTRAAGRERAQQFIDAETRRGRRVRVVVADIQGFRAFNAHHGGGHGDAMLKVIGARLARLAGDDAIAMRWSGDAFLLVQSGKADDMPDARESLARPIVVKGSEEPLQLALGVAESDARTPLDELAAEAEAALAADRGR
jgi:diguanylate cyclase (GGDEF)-like protein